MGISATIKKLKSEIIETPILPEKMGVSIWLYFCNFASKFQFKCILAIIRVNC